MNDFSSIRCVVFDLDDTLWPCEPTIMNAEQALYDWLAENYPYVTDQFSLQDLIEQRANFAIKNPHISHDMTALRLHSLEELAQKFDYPEHLAKDGLELFRRHRNQVNLYDDALPTIKFLAEYFKMGVITNGNAELDVIGVREYFDFVVTAEDAGVAKPDKEIFEYTRKQVDLASHELLYVGDHPINDVVGSKNSGWKALWFNPDSQQWPKDWPESWSEQCPQEVTPDAQIQSLSELPKVLNL